MPCRVKYVLRHRNGEVIDGAASNYPLRAGWRDFAGVPASVKYGGQWWYKFAEREALRMITDEVLAGNDDKTRRHNADLYWAALNAKYVMLGVHPTYRKQRPA